MTESISQTFPDAKNLKFEERAFQAVSVVLSVNSTFKRSVLTINRILYNSIMRTPLHYLLAHFNSKMTTEKGGSLPFKTLPANVNPLNPVGFTLSGCSKVL